MNIKSSSLAAQDKLPHDNRSSSSWAPWLAFTAAILASTVTSVSSIYLWHSDKTDRIKHEMLQERKAALFQALHVIDLVYANSHFSGQPPLPTRKWDIQLARDAMNRMTIYCKEPDKMVPLFFKAIGLYNPNFEAPRGFNAGYIHNFRKAVAQELDLPEITFVDPNNTWIYALPGTDEGEAIKREKNKPNRH